MSETEENALEQELESGRRCPVYATMPMKILGMDAPLAIGAMVVMAISKPILVALIGGNFGNVVSFALAGLYVYLTKKATKGQERGYLIHRVAVLAGTPSARKYAPWMSTGIYKSWINAKSVPPATIVNRYEV